MRKPTKKRIAGFNRAVGLARRQYVKGNYILAASNLRFIAEVIKSDSEQGGVR